MHVPQLRCCASIVVGMLFLAWSASAEADGVQLKDGRILEGRLAKIGKLADDPLATKTTDTPAIRPVVMIDDDLRRTFVPEYYISKPVPGDNGEVLERIHIAQPVAEGGSRVARVGPILGTTPWDDFGRRRITMMLGRGQIEVIQGITEITPLWTKVEGLAGDRPLIWDMRIATSSIPRDVLSRIIAKRHDSNNIEVRKSLIRLYLQSNRYQDAQTELEKLLAAHPKEQLQEYVKLVRQINAQRILDEINLRRKSGQHEMALAMLERFPTDGVGGEILQQIRQGLTEFDATRKQGLGVLASLKQNLEGIQDSALRERCQGIYDELTRELNIHTLDRMADYVRLGDDPQLSHSEKLALAITGWLMGSGEGATNLQVALSLADTRDLVRQYLRESVKIRRSAILAELVRQEGSSPAQVARLLAHMAPPLDLPAADPMHTGQFALQIPGVDKEPPVNYFIQLPPEYSPFRRYPAVVTLHGAGSTAMQQLDWWAGAPDGKGNRLGQGTRHGYIVIAVEWAKPEQQQYEFSAREHAAVLGSLRDACRRVSVDTNRVFLSGHSMGGDAAWDLALAHPDLWAGVIPIVAVADKYCNRYWENARYVPFYVVAGELDGDKMVRNARDLDRYMLSRFDLTVVEYLGRGHEHFSDEVQRIFDWMGRRTRDFYPKKFKVNTMRSWDDFFWWVELSGFPERNLVQPFDWPPKRGTVPVKVDATLGTTSITVSTGAGKATIWLSPELIDFDGERPVSITINGRAVNLPQRRIKPDLSVILEDARSRGERQHPFWAKIEQ